LVLSHTLSDLLEQAHIRFGLEVCLVSRDLEVLFPGLPTELGRSVTSSGPVRREVEEAQAMGRLHEFTHEGAEYRVYPLRAAGRRAAGGTLVARNPQDGKNAWDDTSGWFVLRSIVEADIAAAECLAEERQHSRRTLAMLRFLRFLVDADSEGAVTQALVQAAAIWYDVDARIYRRNLLGDFMLHTWLPAVEPGPHSGRLGSEVLGSGPELVRLPFLEESADAAAQTALIVPLRGSSSPEWLMALVGTVPADSDLAFEAVGRVAGAQLELLRQRRAESLRQRVQGLFSQTGPPERIAVRAVRELMELTEAGTAAITLTKAGSSRRLVRIGAVGEEVTSTTGKRLFAPDQFVCPLPLADGMDATLELRPPADGVFTTEAALMTRSFADVLTVWLGAIAPTLSELGEEPRVPCGFERRIHEELERAQRFDLRLSLILIESEAPLTSVTLLEQALRRELRGSDVLGRLSANRLAALLTHTSSEGLSNVVQRLRRTLAHTLESFDVPGLLLGQAAFSPDLRTADALLSEAARQARPVVVVN
jgi:hypothetical protein